jgi:hypothetical protein
MGKQWLDGDYEVVNKSKYIGEKPPHYRSSWELRAIQYFDHSPNVLKWGSECLVIPYYYELDKKTHKYYPDFYFEAIDKFKKIRKFIVEIKPQKQMIPPRKPKNVTQKSKANYLNECATYIKNQNKWKTAKEFCSDRGFEFVVISETSLFPS